MEHRPTYRAGFALDISLGFRVALFAAPSQDLQMKYTLGYALLCAFTVVNAQTVPRPVPPASGQNFQIPPGWVLVQPNSSPPKDGKDAPYMIPYGAIGSGGLTGGGGANPLEAILVRAQTDSIKALAKRIEELDARVKELENQNRGVAKK